MANDKIQIKFKGVTSTPTIWEKDTLYAVYLGGDVVEGYITSNNGIPKQLGNTQFVQNIINQNIQDGELVDLSYIAAADQGTIANNAGDNAIIPLATEQYAGLFSPEEKEILANLVQDGLVYPGVVIWSGVGFIYNVSQALIKLGGTPHLIDADQVTLVASDPTNPRIDVVFASPTGFGVLTGTPAAEPVMPQVDPSTQVFLTSIIVAAATTEPGDITGEDVYQENEEYTISSVGTGTTNPESTTFPFAGLYAIESTSIQAGYFLTANKGSNFTYTNFDTISFRIRLKEGFSSRQNLTIYLLDSGGDKVAQGITIQLNKSLIGQYQFIAVPISAFTLAASNQARSIGIEYTRTGGGSSLHSGFYIDDWKLQGGISQPTRVTEFLVQDENGVTQFTTENLIKLEGVTFNPVTKVVTIPTPIPLLQEQATDAYVGLRLKPVNASINGFLVDRSVNQRTGFEAVNTNSGNAATTSFIARGSSNLYDKVISMQWFGAGYNYTYLRDKGALYSTDTIFHLSANATGSHEFRTGSTFQNQTKKFKVWYNGAIEIFRATLASITNAAAGFLIGNSEDNNRPNYHNGTEWKGLAYVDEVGASTLQEVTDNGNETTNMIKVDNFNIGSGNAGFKSLYLSTVAPHANPQYATIIGASAGFGSSTNVENVVYIGADAGSTNTYRRVIIISTGAQGLPTTASGENQVVFRTRFKQAHFKLGNIPDNQAREYDLPNSNGTLATEEWVAEQIPATPTLQEVLNTGNTSNDTALIIANTIFESTTTLEGDNVKVQNDNSLYHSLLQPTSLLFSDNSFSIALIPNIGLGIASNKELFIPNSNGTLATEEWVAEQIPATPTEEQIIGTAIEDASVTGTYNLDLSTFSDALLNLTGNTTITVSNTPSAGKSFTKTLEITSAAAETLTLPSSWFIIGTYRPEEINSIEIKFSNYTTAGEKVLVEITAITPQIVSSFISRVIADGGTFEAKKCLINNILSL